MYNYEIIIENTKVKSNDFEHLLKIIKNLIDKDYVIIFKSNNKNINITLYDIFDIAMLEDIMKGV